MSDQEQCQHVFIRSEDELFHIDKCKFCGYEVKISKEVQQAATAVAQVDNSPYAVIERALRTQKITERVRLALGHTTNDETAKAEAFKYISSVLMEVQKSMGDSKRDLTVCTPDSIVQSIIDAATFRLPIDGRGLAYLVKYGTRASFQPGYKGLLYKIAEQFRDVDFTAEPVFSEDKLQIEDKSGYQTYSLAKSNPFENDAEKMIGVIACLAYSTDAGRHSKVVALSTDEIKLIRSKAKQDFIWKEWFFEKAKAAALKRLCKIHFTNALGVQALAQFDNEEHFAGEPEMNDITPPKPAEKLNQILEGKVTK